MFQPYVNIVAGIHNKWHPENSERVHAIANVHIHPDYRRKNNDIALVQLETELEYSHEILPVCLPREAVPSGRDCVTTGWGDTNGTHNFSVFLFRVPTY